MKWCEVDWMPGQTEFGCCLWLEIDGKKIAFTGAYLLLAIPAPLRDWVYGLIARNRYKFFGKREACRMPTKEERQKFLD